MTRENWSGPRKQRGAKSGKGRPAARAPAKPGVKPMGRAERLSLGKGAPRPKAPAPEKPAVAKALAPAPAPAPAPAKSIAPKKGAVPAKPSAKTPAPARSAPTKGAPAPKAAPERRAPKAPAPHPVPRTIAYPEFDAPERAGFALLLGRPNVGKSTLLNRLVGEHVAAVSPKPQTTRHRILGVVNAPNTQLCLLDVPGVHKAKGILNRAMVEAALSSITEVDVVLLLAEAGWPRDAEPGAPIDPIGPTQRELIAQVERAGKPVVLVLTKVDLLPKPLLLPLIDAWRQAFSFREIYPLSGMTGENVAGLLGALRPHLPEGPPLFPVDTLTDQTERTLVGELVREQVFLQTRDEVPYGVAIAVELFDESERDSEEAGKKGLVRIEASVVVDRESHKGIVIGQGGQRLRDIGAAARHNIERLLGCRVFLGLHVRVIPGWTETQSRVTEFGIGSDVVRR